MKWKLSLASMPVGMIPLLLEWSDSAQHPRWSIKDLRNVWGKKNNKYCNWFINHFHCVTLLVRAFILTIYLTLWASVLYRNTRPTFAAIRIANAGAGRFGPVEAVAQTGGGTCPMDRCVSAVCQRAEWHEDLLMINMLQRSLKDHQAAQMLLRAVNFTRKQQKHPAT